MTTWALKRPAPLAPVPVQLAVHEVRLFGAWGLLRSTARTIDQKSVTETVTTWHDQIRLVTDIIDQDGEQVVGWMTVTDFWRDRLCSAPVPESRIRYSPAADVWIETHTVRDLPDDQPVPDGIQGPQDGDGPPPRVPVPARQVPRMLGRDIIFPEPAEDEWLWGTVAGPVYDDGRGTWLIPAIDDAAWWRWTLLGEPPQKTVPFELGPSWIV